MKCMVMYQYTTCDMHFMRLTDELIYEISTEILCMFKRYNVLQMVFFNLV